MLIGVPKNDYGKNCGVAFFTFFWQGVNFFLQVEQENKGNLFFRLGMFALWSVFCYIWNFRKKCWYANLSSYDFKWYSQSTNCIFSFITPLKHQSPQGCEPALGAYQFARDFLCNVAEMTGGQAIALSSAAMLADVTWQPWAMGHGWPWGACFPWDPGFNGACYLRSLSMVAQKNWL